jgi:putative ABC transport system substrate-binding protein
MRRIGLAVVLILGLSPVVDRLPDLAVELAALKVDVIVTASEPAIRSAKKATSTIPIVFAVAGGPVATDRAEADGRGAP